MRWPSFSRNEPQGSQSPSPAVSRGRVIRGPWRPLRRAFKAAKQDRLTADWLSGGGDLNQELKSQLPILRSRARELEQNSNLARRFLQLCETHVVGPDGFTLQVKGKLKNNKPDTKGNAVVEADFKRWAKRGVCEITGLHSLVSAKRLSIRTGARDGEFLIRMHDVKPSLLNPWGFVIELLDPDRLDHLLNDDLKNGHRIRMGVELTNSGRPVAYYLKTGERTGFIHRRDKHERVPVEDVIHWFDPLRPEQLRGATWMASAMLTIHQVEAYQEAAITAARAGASKMGWYKTPDGNAHALADEEDDDGELLEEFEPGHLGVLPDGYDFIGFDPKYPHEAYEPFIKTNHHDIALGLGVSYHALTGQLTDVNFSSIRSGTLEERERWKVLQDLFSVALQRIYLRWLTAATLNNRFSHVSQEEALHRYSDHHWQGRRWPWVDPLKDIKAVVEAINTGLTSPQRAAAELGVELEELLDEIAVFQKMLKDKGITLPILATPVQGVKEKEGGNNADEND